MNHRSSGLLISDAIEGLLLAKRAEGRSPRTITGYRHDLRVWLDYAGDRDVAHVTPQEIHAFLLYLRTAYQPQRLSGNGAALSAKTIRNFWVSLSALFSWLRDAFELPNPMAKVPAPTFSCAELEPFQQADVEALLRACDRRREAQTHQRRRYTMRRPTALRDRAIILTLLDTGLRSSELCALTVGDVDLKSGKGTIRGGVAGGAWRGRQEPHRLPGRYRPAGSLALSGDPRRPVDERAPLFSAGPRRLTRDALRHLVGRLGDAAHVKNAHPHRFRHTYALTYLRCGGDVFTLQHLLGHGSLDMVQCSARLAQIDRQQAHRRASPGDSWQL
jgi:integrase/recombinase XerD